MSGFCGWFGRGQSDRVVPEVLMGMAASINGFDRGTVRSASADYGAIAASGEGSSVFQDDGRLFAVWGHAHFLDGALETLRAAHGAARALAQGYAKGGAGVLPLLSGACASAILDYRQGSALLATDRMGIRPVFYRIVGQDLVFGSTLDAISAFPGAPAEIDRQRLFDYVYFHMVPAPGAILAGCHRLLPGWFVTWRDGRAETNRYWEMRYLESEQRPVAELKNALRAALRQGVRDAAQGASVGTFLSGGTDSSTIAGLLGEVTGRPARTYSIGFDAQAYDEMHYARIAARHFGTLHHEYYVTASDVVAAIPRIAEMYDQPFGNSSVVPTHLCARLAKDDGVDVLLGGDGGDELFGGNERYAKQYLYSLYSELPGAARKVLIDPVVSLLPEIGIAGKLKRYVANAALPMPARYDNYNLLERLGASNIFSPEFLAGLNAHGPHSMLEHAYREARADSLINRMLALDLRFTLADNDLPKVVRACELAGVEARFPMLQDVVVSFSSTLPPELKLRGTRLRYLFKEALRGFLPDEILAKTKHGFGLPFGPWLGTHAPLRELALDSLSDLKGRGIVRPAFLEELIRRHVVTHAHYYGSMVWVLMMLEQWLKHHRYVV